MHAEKLMQISSEIFCRKGPESMVYGIFSENGRDPSRESCKPGRSGPITVILSSLRSSSEERSKIHNSMLLEQISPLIMFVIALKIGSLVFSLKIMKNWGSDPFLMISPVSAHVSTAATTIQHLLGDDDEMKPFWSSVIENLARIIFEVFWWCDLNWIPAFIWFIIGVYEHHQQNQRKHLDHAFCALPSPSTPCVDSLVDPCWPTCAGGQQGWTVRRASADRGQPFLREWLTGSSLVDVGHPFVDM